MADISAGHPLANVAGTSSGTSSVEAISQTDVITWVSRGTGDDVIVDRIRHAPNAVHLTAGDEQKMRDAGVTDDVIRAIRATAWN